MSNDTPTDDEPTREELAQRVGRLESMVQSMVPGRRDLLKAGAGAVAGGALVTGASSPAAAATTFVEVDEVRGSGGATRIEVGDPLNIPGALSTGSIATTAYDWTDETSNRSFSTWYQAPSDQDIYFVVGCLASSDGTKINPAIDVNASQTGNGVFVTAQFADNGGGAHWGPIRVPAGYYYQFRDFGDTANYTLNSWRELK